MVATVGVAWLFASVHVFVHPYHGRAERDLIPIARLHKRGCTLPPRAQDARHIYLSVNNGQVLTGVGYEVIHYSGRVAYDSGGTIPWSWCDRVASGWPLLALTGERWECDLPEPVYYAALPPLRREGSDLLPLLPLWPGFAVDTAFYAAIVWLLIRGPCALRRFVRRMRGLCPDCAYPVGGAAICTECGARLQRRAVA